MNGLEWLYGLCGYKRQMTMPNGDANSSLV
jgi:hypothetical protein